MMFHCIYRRQNKLMKESCEKTSSSNQQQQVKRIKVIIFHYMVSQKCTVADYYYFLLDFYDGVSCVLCVMSAL